MTAIILSLILAGLGLRQACFGFLGLGVSGIAEHLTERTLERSEKMPDFWQFVSGVALILAALAVARWG